MSCPTSLVTTAQAVSSRSTCRKCKQIIEKGEMRVGVEAWVAGRQSMTWQHPICFVSNLDVEVVSKGVTGSCKQTRTKIEKGSVRTTVWSNTAKFYLSIAGIYVLLEAITQTAGSSSIDQWCLEHINGLKSLPQELQHNWLAGLKEMGMMKPVAIVTSPSSVVSTSPKRLQSVQKRRRNVKREEEESSEDDLDESGEDGGDDSEEDDDDDDEYREEVMPQKKIRKFVEAM